MAHPHANNMKLYAEDAAELDEPWLAWQVYTGREWCELDRHPQWKLRNRYRRRPKPRVITIKGLLVLVFE